MQLVLLVTLLAQTPTPPPPPPEVRLPLESVEEPAPRSEQVYPPPEEAHAPSAATLGSETSMPKRLFLEFGGGLAGAAVSVVIGFGVGCSLDSLAAGAGTCGAAGAILPVVLTIFALPYGVFVAGGAVGGRGNMLTTVGGFFLGAAAIIPAVMVFNSLFAASRFGLGPLFDIGAATTTALLPFAGAIAGYELSHAFGDDAVPVALINRDGATFGVALRF